MYVERFYLAFRINQRLTHEDHSLAVQLSQGHKHVVPILYWHIARVMLIIEESRRAAGYGTFESRMYRDSAVPSTTSSVRMLDTAISLFLLGAHGRYRKSLRTINLNDFVSLEEFTTLMRSLLAEWADTNLLGSVFLSYVDSVRVISEISLIVFPGPTSLFRQ